MRQAILTALVLLSTIYARPAVADSCSFEPRYTQDNSLYYVWICQPEYYVWTGTEPDWCLYVSGDRVAVQYNQQWQPIAWIVYPYGDPAGNYAEYMVINEGGSSGCHIVVWS